MKTRHLLLLLFFLFSFPVFNLYAQDCEPPTSISFLDANNVKATVGHGGLLWEEDGYFIPGDLPDFASVSAMRNGFFWMGGVDPGGNLKLAADWKDLVTDATDYSSGPLLVSNDPLEAGTTNEDLCNLFSLHSEVSQLEIDQYLADFDADGQVDEAHSNVFLWPGRSNPFYEEEFGVTLPDQPLAPFVDLNGNNIYEPLDGEYPDIKGDEAVWWVINDNGSLHINTGAAPAQFEIGILAYSFANENEAINNTTFYELTLYNRALEDIDSTFAALAVQMGLGCPDDDYFGCIPEEDIAYVYNSDDTDGTQGCNCTEGYNTYCQAVPVLGFKFLETPENTLEADRHLANVGYMNDITGAPKTSRPITAAQYYNRLSGSWNDGTPYLDQGDGTTDGEPTAYLFDGVAATGQGQNMCTENLIADYRTLLMSTGPYHFTAGESGKITFAVFFMENMGACVDTDSIIFVGEGIQEFYDTGIISSSESPLSPVAEVMVLPNPTRYSTQIRATKAIDWVELYESNGKMIRQYEGVDNHQLTVEKKALPAGVYFYRLMLGNGQMASGKLVFKN